MPEKNIVGHGTHAMVHTHCAIHAFALKYYETALCASFSLQSAMCQWFLFRIYCMWKIEKADHRGGIGEEKNTGTELLI